MSKECLDNLNAWLEKRDKHGQPHARILESIEDEFDRVAEETDKQQPGLLGRGSYGMVWRCEKKAGMTHLGHIPDGKVAVKEINKRRVCNSKKNLKWTMIEIAVLRGLQHEYIVDLYDVVHTEESIFLTMEICDGELFYFIASQRRLKPDVSAIILKQILKALAHIHAQGVVHRDVKPENVVINKETLQIKLIDFGLAKYCGSKGQGGIDLEFAMSPSPGVYGYSQEASTPGGSHVPASPLVAATPCGTELYMALESIRGSLAGATTQKWYSTKSRLPKIDVYAAGVIAYAMLTGRLPYRSMYKQARHPGERELRLKDIESKMDKGFPFPDSAGGLPIDALECVRDLMCHDPIARPSAIEALHKSWLVDVKVPVRDPGNTGNIVELKPVVAQDKSKIALKMPGKKKAAGAGSKSASPVPQGLPTAPMPPPVNPQPRPQGQAEAIVFVPDEEMKDEAIIANMNSPEDVKRFRQGFNAMMQQVRQGEDDDQEIKDKDEEEQGEKEVAH